MKKLFFMMLMFVWLVMPTMLVAAQNEEPADPTNLAGVLVWLSGTGAVAAVSWLAANFLEKMKWWNALPSAVKWVVPPVFSILLAFGAQVLLKQEILLAQIQPYFSLVVMILLSYFGSQAGHTATRFPRFTSARYGDITRDVG